MILKYMSNVTNLDKVTPIPKMIFLLTNFIYFIPILLYGFNEITFMIMLIGCISLLYHSYQCKCSTNPICKYLLMGDCIFGSFLAFLVLYRTPTDINYAIVIPFGILAFIFLLKGNNDRAKETYLFLHSMWHLITGFIFLYIAQVDNQNKKKTQLSSNKFFLFKKIF